MNRIFVIIDLGSNSVRMMINEVHADGTFDVLKRRQSMVRLSKDMGAKKILTEEAMNRTIDALLDFKKDFESLDKKNTTVIAVATAAVRQASNKDKFLEKFKKALGFDLRVITGLEEAGYDYKGIIRSLSLYDGLIMDTGGASTELILVKSQRLVQRISLPIGSVNLTESYLEKDKVSAAAFYNAMRHISSYYQNVSWLAEARNYPIFAVGGSNRTLAKISRRRKNKSDLPIHGYHMSGDEILTIYQEILGKNSEERAAIRGLARDRADIIIGGLLPITLLLQVIDSAQVIFSQSGIREGILFTEIEKLTEHTVPHPFPQQLTQDEAD